MEGHVCQHGSALRRLTFCGKFKQTQWQYTKLCHKRVNAQLQFIQDD